MLAVKVAVTSWHAAVGKARATRTVGPNDISRVHKTTSVDKTHTFQAPKGDSLCSLHISSLAVHCDAEPTRFLLLYCRVPTSHADGTWFTVATIACTCTAYPLEAEKYRVYMGGQVLSRKLLGKNRTALARIRVTSRHRNNYHTTHFLLTKRMCITP